MRFRAIVLLLLAIALPVGWTLVGPAPLGGAATYVTTYGDSMEPGFHAGDFAIVRAADEYAVGDVTAYDSEKMKTVVMHRIIEIDDGRYILQGDNNDFIDPDRPTKDQLVGKLALRIPQGGVWLHRLTSPPALALIAFGLVAAGGTTVSRRRRLRRRTVSQHAARTTQRSSRSLNGLPSWATTTAAAAGVVGVLGVTLGAFAWTTSTEPVALAVETSTSDSNQTMTFSYTADVPSSPAYDDTTVTAPQPVFRNLTDDVEVEYTYRGAPGTIAVAAQLSTTSGWQSTVPLGIPQTFTEDEYQGSVSLDLKALEKRAFAAAEVTGIPVSQVDVKVVPTVTTEDAKPFKPELALTVTPLQLTLAGDESSLMAGETAKAEAAGPPTAPTLGFAGREIPVETARILSLVVLVAVLLAAAFVGLFARRSVTVSEADSIRRRYASMLVKVQPMPAPAGRPVIDVVDFPTLAKLAERYELLVLHWSRSDVETFVVQDQGTTYRYRTGAGVDLTNEATEATTEVTSENV